MLKFIAPSAILGALIGGLTVAGVTSQNEETQSPELYIPLGRQVLENFRCGEGETKQTYVKGIIDDFSTQGDEIALLGLSDDIMTSGDMPRILTFNANYDSFSGDEVVAEIFEIPTDIASGILVTSFRPLNGGVISDILNVGNSSRTPNVQDALYIPPFQDEPGQYPHAMFAARKSGPYPDWEQFHIGATTYKLPLGELKLGTLSKGRYLNSQHSILDLLQASGFETYPLLVYMSEDHTVDYFALSICERPPRHLGATFTSALPTLKLSGTIWNGAGLACSAPDEKYDCNSDRGDTSCEEAHSVACFQDLGTQVPENLRIINNVWTGGNIGYTEPFRGSDLKTLSMANELCRKTFGKDWRVLSAIETGGASSLLGHGETLPSGERVWLDTPGAPYGSCWDRER